MSFETCSLIICKFRYFSSLMRSKLAVECLESGGHTSTGIWRRPQTSSPSPRKCKPPASSSQSGTETWNIDLLFVISFSEIVLTFSKQNTLAKGLCYEKRRLSLILPHIASESSSSRTVLHY